jgi:hypothetical protein
LSAFVAVSQAFAHTHPPHNLRHPAANKPDSSALSGGLKNTLGTLSIDTMVSASAEQPIAAPATQHITMQQ